MTDPARVERLAARLRMTEGQLYSSVITLAFAVLLATGLGGVHGVVSSSLAQPPLAPLAPVTELPPVTVPTAAPTPVPAPGEPPAPPFDTAALPLPVPSASRPDDRPGPTPGGASPRPKPTASASPSPSEPCTAQPVADTAAGAVWTLDDAAGGGLPDGDLIAAIALVTGCSPNGQPSASASPSPAAAPRLRP